MKTLLPILGLLSTVACTTIHYRSNNSVPVSYAGNPLHQKEFLIEGKRDFLFWGLNPDHHEVFVDEEIRKAGYNGASKLIIYEAKSPQETLISFLTFGIYMPRSYVITGFTEEEMLPVSLRDSAPPSVTK